MSLSDVFLCSAHKQEAIPLQHVVRKETDEHEIGALPRGNDLGWRECGVKEKGQLKFGYGVEKRDIIIGLELHCDVVPCSLDPVE